MRRYLRPRWLLVHLLAVLVVAVLVSLGVWQLQRLDERRARNDLFAERVANPIRPLGELVDPDAAEGQVDDLRFRTVSAGGTYVDGGTTSVRTTQEGASGGWVFSVMDVGDGEEVVVLRGFTGLADDGSVPEPPPPDLPQVVAGVAIPIERLAPTARTAVRRIADERRNLLPLIVQASLPEESLTPVPTPDLDDEGPHLSYAVQWFLFATVATVGYPILLRRRAED